MTDKAIKWAGQWGGELRWDGDTVLDTRPVGRPPAAKWAVAWREVRRRKGAISTVDLARHLFTGWRVARMAVCCYEIRTRFAARSWSNPRQLRAVGFGVKGYEVLGVYGGSV